MGTEVLNVCVQSFKPNCNQGEVVDWGWRKLPYMNAPSPPKDDMCLSLRMTRGTSTVVKAGGDWWYLGSDGKVRLPYEIAEEIAAGPEYIEPTDEDAKSRPEVEVATSGLKWQKAMLLAVVEAENDKKSFAVIRADRWVEAWPYCRIPNPKYRG